MTATTKMDDEENDENESEKTSNLNIIKTKVHYFIQLGKIGYDYIKVRL